MLDVREQREDKRDLKLAVQSAAKQRGSAELSARSLTDVALATSQGPASQDTEDLDDLGVIDAERALVGSNGTNPDGRGLVDECGRGVSSERASTAAPTATSASTVDLTDYNASAWATEPVPAGQPRTKPRATSLGRPPSAS